MNEVTIAKVVDENHLTIGEAFAKRVIATLQTGKLDIVGYAVREYSSSNEERLELNIGDKRTLVITFGQNKY